MKFKHELGAKVMITISDEAGEVIGREEGEIIGRTEYKTQNPQYFIRFQSVDGRFCTSWWEAYFLDTVE